MTYLGDFAIGVTLDHKFSTPNPATGAPLTLAGAPVVAAYPDNSLTEITAGITLTVDFDGRTGLHNVRVVATTGNGYASGVNYALVLTAGTVNAVGVNGTVIGRFSIEARSALRPTVPARTADVTATGALGIDWGNVENQGTVVQLGSTLLGEVSQVNVLADAAINSGTFDTGAIDAAALAADAVAEIADGVWDEAIAGHLTAGSTGAKLNSAGSATNFPAGAITYTYTVTDSLTGFPVDGVQVWIATDAAGTNIVWSGVTDEFGVARDVNNNKPSLNAGSYFLWKQLSNYSETNPQSIVVS